MMTTPHLPDTLGCLLEQRPLLDVLLGQSGSAILICDVKTNILYLNEAARRLLRSPSDDAPLTDAASVFGQVRYPDGRVMPLAAWSLSQALRGEAAVNHQERVVRSDGSYTDLFVSATPLWETDEAVVGAVITAVDISQLRLAEEVIRTQAELLEQVRDAVLVWDVGGGITHWYPGAAALYGWTAAEAVGQEPRTLFRTSTPVSWGAIERALQTDGQWIGELMQFTKEGRRIVVESRMSLIPAGSGPPSVVEVNRDITERVLAEQHIRHLASFPEFNPNPVIEVDADGLVIFYNEAANVALDAAGSPGIQAFLPADLGDALALLPLEQSQTFYREVDVGSRMFAETIQLMAEFNTARLYAIDITERHRAETLLRDSEERYRQLFQGSGAPMLVIDPPSQAIIDANPAACAFYGYDGPTLTSLQIIDINTLPPEQIAQEMANAVAQRRNYFLFNHHLASGEIRNVEVYSSPIHIQGRTLLFSIIHDITERQRAERQVLSLLTERERVRVLNQFVRDISHDFKTPLATINTSLYLLKRLTDPEQRHHHVKIIGMQTKRLSRLLDSTLTITRLDSTEAIDLHPIEANNLTREVYARLEEAAVEKQVEVALDLEEGALPVEADGDELDRAVWELAQNAVQFTPAGGSITLRTRRQAEAMTIEVQDTGIGIAEEDLPHIFGRLYRAEKARTTEVGNVGLGLSIARRIVELHQGTVAVKSAPGKGSTFQIRLPLLEGGELPRLDAHRL